MKRLFFKTLDEDLNKHQIRLILGAGQVGKTTLIKQLHKELGSRNRRVAFINLENNNKSNNLAI